MDPLSDVLTLLNPRSAMSARLVTGGAWAMEFPAYDGVKFTVIANGTCFLAVDSMEQTIPLKAGDCYLLTDGSPYRLGSDLSLPAIDARAVFENAGGGIARYGDVGNFMAIGGKFTFDTVNASVLFNVMPPVIHIDATSDHAAVIRWVLTQLVEEVSNTAAGATLMTDHLAHIMLVQALRAYLASAGVHPVGWLGGLADERMAVAMRLIHESPSEKWTVDGLATAAGMSRSAFAKRFKTLVGSAPLDYLIQWRMRLAARDLLGGGKTVSTISQSLGYASESAFSNAFKRVMGRAPTHYKGVTRELSEPVEAEQPGDR
jgi:AraC-like DNA-binding protein